jgi:ketosteroid isomerase-like protein
MDEIARNVAAIQRGWDAFNAANVSVERVARGRLAPMLEVLDRGIVWDVTDVGVPGLGEYLGHRGVIQFVKDWFEVVGNVQTNVLEMRGAGDKVLCVCRQTGSGIASGATVTWEFAMVFTMRDGKATRMKMYGSIDEAREVAGIDPAGVAIMEPL